MGSGPFPSSTTSTRPGPFAGLPVPPQNVGGGGGPVSNGPPMFGPGGMQGGPQYPPRPSAGPQHSPPTMSSPAGPFTGQPTPYSGSLPDQPPRGPPAFSAQSPGMPPPQASLFGAQAQPWQMQPRQNVPPPPILGSGQPPRMFGMQPPLPNQQSMATISPAMGAGGSAVTGPSKIDPNQIPQPIPNPSVLLHETRQGNQANPPPPATSEFIVRDTGNCSPRYMRCTINQIGCTSDILTTSGMQLALLVQPLALPHPSEEPIQAVSFLTNVDRRCPLLVQVREQVTNLCISILHAYRKFCATVSSSGQLILPEALKLLPLYTLALIKSIGLRTDAQIDDRSFWINYVFPLSAQLAIPFVYPRMISIHDLDTKETEGSVIPLSSEQVNESGIYLLENGEDCLIYIGSTAEPDTVRQLFGISSVGEIPSQFVLQQYENPLSKKLNEVINEITSQRCNYLRLKLCKKGDPSGALFLSYMVEDKSPSGLSYVEFLVHVHQQIQSKMA